MLNRRTFLQISGLAGLAALGGGTVTAEEKRPNILWLSTEDISANLGCYGDPNAITPTLDSLAEKGVRFTQAYVTAPVCAPNRSCVISGVFAATLGSNNMRSGGEGSNVSRPPVPPADLQFLPEVLRAQGYYCTNNSKTDYNLSIEREIWSERSGNKAHWRNRPNPDQPFFAVFNYTGTHESKIRATDRDHERTTRELKDNQRQDPDTMIVPPYHVDTPTTRRQWANYLELITALDYWVADLLQQLEEDGLADDTIVIFWSDHGAGLPRGKRWLYDSGVHVPVIAYAPEKWQNYAGIKPGTVVDRLVSCLDLAPTTLALAGAPIPDTMQGQPFLGSSLGPEPDYVYATRDRMDERYDMMRMVRDKRYKYIRNYKPFLPYNQFISYAEQSPVKQDLNQSLLGGKQPLDDHWIAAKTKPVEELYDTETDPNELNNLAELPEYEPVLNRMRKEHQAWSAKIRDIGLLPESELNRLGKLYGCRYNIYREHEKNYPGFWKQLYATATAAGKPDDGNESLLLQALDSEHPSIRFWAVTGLAQRMTVSGTAKDAVKKHLTDEAPVVAIAAANGILQAGANDAALQTVVKSMKDPDEWVRLQAVTVLDDIGELARPVIPVLQEALNDTDTKYVVRVAEHALNVLLGTDNAVK